MRTIDPAEISQPECHQYLLAGVSPRPIALVGTIDREGRRNLSPFSFFNAFGSNPPVIAFSPAFRGTDGTPKHTLLNVLATGEFTVSVVSHAIVEQISLASSEYGEGVDEFVKSGLTPLPSVKIAPAGVAESPMTMECRLMQHVPLGNGKGSGNLLIGEVVMFHIKESVFDGKYMDANRLDLVARMGGPLYARASGNAVFTLAKPKHNGVGFDALPGHLRHSRVLVGNDLARLAGAVALPSLDTIRETWMALLATPGLEVDDIGIELRSGDGERILAAAVAGLREGGRHDDLLDLLHHAVCAFLNRGDLERAWVAALAPEVIEGFQVGGEKRK